MRLPDSRNGATPYGANSTSSSTSRLVNILERPAGQQFAPFQRLLESAIAVGYVFQFSGRSRDGLEDHAGLRLRIVDEKLLLRNGYLVAENRVLRNQIQGRLRLTDAKRPGATVLSPFVFLDTTA